MQSLKFDFFFNLKFKLYNHSQDGLKNRYSIPGIQCIPYTLCTTQPYGYMISCMIEHLLTIYMVTSTDAKQLSNCSKMILEFWHLFSMMKIIIKI